MNILLFIVGALFGSFLGVVAGRYDPDRFIFTRHTIGGRSHCPHCGKTLRAFELIPLISFIIQRGRCRGCRARISLLYPVVEVVSGLLFVLVPASLSSHAIMFFPHLHGAALIVASALWIFVFLSLFLIALIDLRISLIPDELNVCIALASIVLAAYTAFDFGPLTGSFSGSYASLFGFRDGLIMNRAVGALFGLVFFGVLILITRGRGMGMGDLKLSVALGILFGWPDIIFVVTLAFISGSLLGILEMVFRGKRMRSSLSFGPFLAIGAALVFFFGRDILSAYFGLFPLP